MRPSGDIRNALFAAALELSAPALAGQLNAPRPTLRELAHRACVGLGAASATVKNMTRAGQLRLVNRRHVSYCNRPVAEYEPVLQVAAENQQGPGNDLLMSVITGWSS